MHISELTSLTVMGLRGRKPKPTALKLIEGNKSRRPLNLFEPELSSACPEPPAHLTPDALAEWHKHCRDLHAAGMLTVSDTTALAAYCQLYGRWVMAERALDVHMRLAAANGECGFITTSPNGAMMQHALVGVANTAARDAMRYAAELGLTPSARSRIKVNKPTEKASPAAKYFA